MPYPQRGEEKKRNKKPDLTRLQRKGSNSALFRVEQAE
jgi:hypothetical protein